MGCIECRKGKDEEAGEKDRLLEGAGRQYCVPYPERAVDRHIHVRVQHGRPGPSPPPPLYHSTDTRDSSELQVGGTLKSKVSRTLGDYASDKDIKTRKGQEILTKLCRAYRWKNDIEDTSQEFLAQMDRLYMECQLHLTALASRGDVESKREADVIVNEMVALRNHWGPGLLPNSTCNAFVREKIHLTLGVEQRQFRIECTQYFEPVPVSSLETGNPNEPLKLYRFSVYEHERCVLRYYLHRFKATITHHVLLESKSRQIHSYGPELPSYWDIRQHLLEAVYSRLNDVLEDSDYLQNTDISHPEEYMLKGPEVVSSERESRRRSNEKREDSALCSGLLNSDEDVY